MMKVILSISIVLNLILGYFTFIRKPEKEIEVVERLVIETHGNQVARGTPKLVPPPAVPNPGSKKKDLPELGSVDDHELQDASEKMEQDRVDFMTNELGMSEETISLHNKLRDEFSRKTSLFWQKNPMRELSFTERRQLIDLEEDLHQKLEKLHGKKAWDRYQKFRERYNQKGFKKQMDDGKPFLFMGL